MTDTPTWYTWARRDIGVAELPGLKQSNERIENYRKLAKIKLAGDDSTIPWCAIFVNAALEANGIKGTRSAAARSFLDWGVKVPETFGAIVVLSRGKNPAHGHVGFYRGSAVVDGRKYILVLGGNQGDKVSLAYFPADRVIGYRWPAGVALSKPNPIKLTPTKPQGKVKTS